MATRYSMGQPTIEATPKKTRQGKGQHSKYSATSRNKARKRYRGQGKQNRRWQKECQYTRRYV